MRNIKLSLLENYFTEQPLDEAWSRYLLLTAAALPFWEQAITEMALLTNLPSAKIDRHRQVARNAYTLMHDWYFERIVYVKARRNEIDTTISFIRNTALRKKVALLPGAAAARNLAGALRLLVHMSVHNYLNTYYPHLITRGFLNIAAAKSLFPVDTNDLISQFALPNQPPSDNIEYLQDALDRGATHYGLSQELAQLYDVLNDMWRDSTPQPWIAPASAWKQPKNSMLLKIHYKGIHDFHAKH